MEIEEIQKNNEDKEIILQAVRESGKNLEWASETLQDDKEVVMEALKQDGEALEFASTRLKGDKEVLQLATKTAPFVMHQRNWRETKKLC